MGQPLLKLPCDIGQTLAVAAIGQFGLHMTNDPFGHIDRQATMVVEFAGFTRLNRDAGVGIGGTLMAFVAQ